MAKRGRPPHPDILTPREWEVLALLREGLSNEAIAGRLDITERTARYHVSEILGKLGVSSREEAAAWEPAGRPVGEERRPWWLAAGAPVALLWRKASFGWLSPATAVVLGVVVATGAGLLIWGLVRTGGDGGAVITGASSGIMTPVSAEAFSPDGVPTTYVRVQNGLRPIDPASGQDLPGYDFVYALRGPAAISPDGRTAVVAVQPDSKEPPQLELLDLKYWRPAGTLGLSGSFSEMHWSRDSRRLYVRTAEDCALSPEEAGLVCESTVVTIDVASRKVLFRTPLPPERLNPFGGSNDATFAPAPNGRILYLFGYSVVNPSRARLLAVDLETGAAREELELPDVLWGARPEPGQSDQRFTEHFPAFVVSPDGRRAYIVHAETDRITVLDLQGMRIERSRDVRLRTSLFDRLLSFLAKKTYADGRSPYHEKRAAISPDGRYLYVGGGHALPEEGEPWVVGVYPDESAGLRMIDTDSLEIIAEIEPGGDCEYRNLTVHPSGRYLYATTYGTDPGQTGFPKCRSHGLFVFDARTLEVIANRLNGDAVLVVPAVEPAAPTP